MVKLVVFDWNGTLLADTQAILEGVRQEFGVYGIPATITLAQYRDTFEIPLPGFFARWGVSKKTMKQHAKVASAAFHKFYEPRAARCRTRAGTRAILDWLHKQGINRVILSNHTSEGIYAQLVRLKLDHHFEAVLANDEQHAAYIKGKQARLHEYLKQIIIKPNEAVIVGDTAEEIVIGKDLGLTTVAITGGYYSTLRLKAASPDYLVNNLTQLRTIISSL